MMSLFNSFDLNLNIFNLAPSFILVAMFMKYTQKMNLLFKLFFSANNFLSEFFYSLKSSMFSKNTEFLFLSLFMLLITFNFCSVFSYIFPVTSQLSYVLIISIIFWYAIFCFTIINQLTKFFMHLIPEGCPLPLMVVLFMIETISYLIRPFTVMVRLMANILAGHLLMILLSKLTLMYFSLYFFYLVLNMVEFFVSVVQAYIFTTLMVLYFSEIE